MLSFYLFNYKIRKINSLLMLIPSENCAFNEILLFYDEKRKLYKNVV